MRALQAVKEVAAEALREDQSEDRLREFRSVVDPVTAMEMATIIESLLTYIEKLDDLTAQELAAQTRRRISGQGGADGAP